MNQSRPDTLGKYQIIREIARSNDIVYEGYDPGMHRRVAVKELAMPSGSSDAQKQERIRRFMREAKAAGSLVHPNIVTVYEVSEDQGRHYLVMEFLDGDTLRKEIEDSGFLSQSRAIEVATSVLHALEFAHQNGVVHRDVKPENIQILESGVIKLTDFGIARLTFEPNLTMDGQVFGTPSYMSPEQVNGKDITPASDIFSVGIVLYEMLGGTKPFTGDNVVAITYSILNHEPAMPSNASHALWQIVRKALDKVPSMRYQSATEMIAALEGVGAGMSTAVPPPMLIGQPSSQPFGQPGATHQPTGQTPYGQTYPTQGQPYGGQPNNPYGGVAPMGGQPGPIVQQPYGSPHQLPQTMPQPMPGQAYGATLPPQGAYPGQPYTGGHQPYGGQIYHPPSSGQTYPGAPGQIPIPIYLPPRRKPMMSDASIEATRRLVLVFIVLAIIVGAFIWLIVGLGKSIVQNDRIESWNASAEPGSILPPIPGVSGSSSPPSGTDSGAQTAEAIQYVGIGISQTRMDRRESWNRAAELFSIALASDTNASTTAMNSFLNAANEMKAANDRSGELEALNKALAFAQNDQETAVQIEQRLRDLGY